MLKQPVIQRWRKKDQRKRRVKNCWSRWLCLSRRSWKRSHVTTKQTIERSESGLAEQKTLKKQRVSLTKSSVLKSKQHNNHEIYVSTCLVFKPLGAKQSSRYCQKLSRILFPPVSLSIILTLISFKPVVAFFSKMPEEFHLGYWGPQIKLTTARLVIIKPKPKRRAGATNILNTANSTFQQIHNIWRVTIKRIVYPIFPAIYIRMKMLTITHNVTHLTTRFTTMRISLLINPPISLTIEPSPNKYILKVLTSPKCYKRWLRKHLPMLFRICEHRMEFPGNLPQIIERWMICRNKRNPSPLPWSLVLFPAFARRVALSNLRTLSSCSLTKDSS